MELKILRGVGVEQDLFRTNCVFHVKKVNINPFLMVRNVFLARFLRLAVGLEQHYATCVLLDLRDPMDFVLLVDQGRTNP
jgi:hypothetical protein